MDMPTHPAAGPRENGLLAAFPDAAWSRVERNLQPVWLTLGQSLYAPGFGLDHIYFPVSGIVSLLIATTDGYTAATATVGGEGLLGIALFLGGETTPSSAMVTSAGWAYRLGAEGLMEEFSKNGEVRQLLLRYTQALITQIAQTAVCNRHHSVEQQLCRWLLLSLDRTASNKVNVTQELIARMLGVRREGVSEGAGKLRKLGVISYHRGQIEVIDRPQLAALCCECYGVVAREYDRLLGPYLHAARRVVPSPAAAKRPTPSEAWIGKHRRAPGRSPMYRARTATIATLAR